MFKLEYYLDTLAFFYNESRHFDRVGLINLTLTVFERSLEDVWAGCRDLLEYAYMYIQTYKSMMKLTLILFF